MSDTAPTTSKPRKRRFRILKWVLYTIGGLLALIILLLLFVRFAASTGFGRGFVETRIEAANAAGQDIDIEGLQGDLLGRFTIEELTVADEQGVWLRASDLVLDWKPFALRRRALLVEELAASEIAVLRQPILPPSEEPQQEGGSIPLRLGEVETLDIDRLYLAEGVIPRETAISIDADARVSREEGNASLRVVPEDGDGDELAATLGWEGGQPPQASVNLTGPAGGLFASLMQLDADQSVSVSLNASGAVADWQADGLVTIGGAEALTLNGTGAGETIEVDLDASLEPHPLTRELAARLGAALTLDARVSWAGDVPVINAELAMDQLNASAITRLAGEEIASEVRARIEAPLAIAGVDAANIDAVQINGTALYAGGDANFDGTVDLQGIAADQVSVERISGPLVFDYSSDAVSVDARFEASGARFPADLQALVGRTPSLRLDASYQLADGAVRINELDVNAASAGISASGDIALAPVLSADFAGQFNIDGAAAGLQPPVTARGDFTAERQSNGTTLVTLNSDARNFGTLPEPLGQWLGDSVRLEGRARLMSDGAMIADRLDVSSGSLTLNATGERSADGTLRANADLSAGAAAMAGAEISSVDVSAAISGLPDALDFDLTGTVPTLRQGETELNDISLRLNGRRGGSAITTATRLDARSPAGPVDARADVALDGTAWRVSDLNANWLGLTADANLSGNGGDLTALSGTARVNGPLPGNLPAESVSLDARFDDNRLDVEGALETLALGPLDSDQLNFRANGAPDNFAYGIDLSGRTEVADVLHDTDLRLEGDIRGLVSQAIQLTAALDGAVGPLSLNTPQPARVSVADGTIEADADIETLRGLVSARYRAGPSTSASLTADNLALAPLLSFLGRDPMEGVLSMDANLSASDAGVDMTSEARLTGLETPGADMAPIDIVANADLEGNALVARVTASDNESLEAVVDTRLPVQTQASPPFINLAERGIVPLSVTVDGAIDALTALVLPPDMVARGNLDVDVDGQFELANLMSGALPLEALSGQFALSEGLVEQGALGLVLQDINIGAALDNAILTLQQFNATGRNGGSLTGEGRMALSGSGQSNLTVNVNQLVVTDRPEARVQMSGTFGLQQTAEALNLSGDLTVDEGRINLDALPQGGPPTLDVTFEEPETEEDGEDNQGGESATMLDIQVNAPGRIRVTGAGVDAELGMNVSVTGPAANPVIDGRARIVRGRFELLGKRFTFSDSSIALMPDVMRSRLNITAVRDTDELTAIVNVTGTPERPEISLSSEPELPEDEVLSQVLFGRSPSQLSGLEAARLAAALASMGGGGGFDLMGSLEQALGLDSLTLGQDASGDTELTSGKYLADNVYLEVRTGTSGSPGLAVEWEPIDNIEVEAETRATEGQKLSVQWTRDFD